MTEPGTKCTLQLVTGLDPGRALGLAVSCLMYTPVFARQSFLAVTEGLVNQINRGHYVLAMSDDEVLGFLGWGFVAEAKAEAWLKGDDLWDKDCCEGDVLVITAWASETVGVTMAMLRCLREIGQKQTKVYFKRAYPNGRARPGRLSVNHFVQAHIRAANRSGSYEAISQLYGFAA